MEILRKAADALQTGVGSLLPNCRQAARLQCDALDRPVPRLRRIGLWLHLLICGLCRRYGRQIRFLNHAAHGHPDQLTQAVPQKLSDPARERIKNSLRSAKDENSSHK